MDPNSRRYSGLESFGSPSRPATPARSVSRQSNASERRRSGVPQYGVRPSSRASVFDRPASRTGANQELQDEVDRLQSELSAALKSIEDSRISHLENDRSLKASQARFEEVSRRLEQSESELKAAVGRAQKSEETERIRLEAENKPDDALQAQLTDLQTQLKTLGEAAEESKSKLADQISASEALQQKFDNAKAESEKEKLDLNAQLDTLREAGQDLCAVYEERLREVEEDKQAIQRALQDREADLSAAKEKAQGSEDSIQPPLPPNAMPQTSPAAMAIDNENLRADNEHMRDRIHKLEEQLDDLRYTLESETDRAREKRVQGSEVEATLRQEIEELKSTLEKAHKGEGEVSQHIQQLETALKESQRALENERAELETLRVDSSTSGHAEKTAQLQRQLTAAQDEAREAQQHAKDLEEEISLLEDIKTDQMATQSSETSQQIEQLQSDLKAKTEEVEALQAKRDAQFKRSSSSSNYSSLSTRDREDVPSLKDQIVGLKVIIGQLTDENQELSQQNKDLLTQADTLREAQKALETTVDRYVLL